jgi:hypothetical protein
MRSFNFFGLSVTRNVSATSRSIIDTLRTLFVWLVSLGLGWERFNCLQVLGMLICNLANIRFRDISLGHLCKLEIGLDVD